MVVTRAGQMYSLKFYNMHSVRKTLQSCYKFLIRILIRTRYLLCHTLYLISFSWKYNLISRYYKREQDAKRPYIYNYTRHNQTFSRFPPPFCRVGKNFEACVQKSVHACDNAFSHLNRKGIVVCYRLKLYYFNRFRSESMLTLKT